MRALKVIVIVMGIMLVGGFATLIVVIAGRVAQKQTAAIAPQTFAAPAIELPAGARIDSMAMGVDRLVLHLALPDGIHELVVIELASGRRLGAIPLRTAQ